MHDFLHNTFYLNIIIWQLIIVMLSVPHVDCTINLDQSHLNSRKPGNELNKSKSLIIDIHKNCILEQKQVKYKAYTNKIVCSRKSRFHIGLMKILCTK
jgi:biopolymer transport protein ExbD